VVRVIFEAVVGVAATVEVTATVVVVTPVVVDLFVASGGG
jgi:hypothetical protein